MINLIGGVSHSRFDLIVAKLFGWQPQIIGSTVHLHPTCKSFWHDSGNGAMAQSTVALQFGFRRWVKFPRWKVVLDHRDQLIVKWSSQGRASNCQMNHRLNKIAISCWFDIWMKIRIGRRTTQWLSTDRAAKSNITNLGSAACNLSRDGALFCE
jgi:hypothetical protein